MYVTIGGANIRRKSRPAAEAAGRDFSVGYRELRS